jgi:hypothetical protein
LSLHIQPDWLPILGEFVEIRLHGVAVCAGVVDAVTNDNEILWLSAYGPRSRTMMERADGYTVWIEYKWETNATSCSAVRELIRP